MQATTFKSNNPLTYRPDLVRGFSLTGEAYKTEIYVDEMITRIYEVDVQLKEGETRVQATKVKEIPAKVLDASMTSVSLDNQVRDLIMRFKQVFDTHASSSTNDGVHLSSDHLTWGTLDLGFRGIGVRLKRRQISKRHLANASA